MMPTGLEKDEYGTVLPTEQTAWFVADKLANGQSVLIALYLGDITMMNILFAIPHAGQPANAYRLGGGEMCVAVDRTSMYQFDIAKEGELHWNYVGEKLKLPEPNAKVMADFINKIKEQWRTV